MSLIYLMDDYVARAARRADRTDTLPTDDTRRLVVLAPTDLPMEVAAKYLNALPLGELRERIAAKIANGTWTERGRSLEVADAVLRVLLAESGDAS